MSNPGSNLASHRFLVEELAEDVHQAWMDAKRTQGVTSRRSETGEELMVPYGVLSEPAKDLDRSTVRAVLAAISRRGYDLVEGGAQGDGAAGVRGRPGAPHPDRNRETFDASHPQGA